MPTRRNPVIRHSTLLRKGGAHTESVSGKRHQSKRQLDDEVEEYYDQRANSQRTKLKGTIPKERDDSAPSSIFNMTAAIQTDTRPFSRSTDLPIFAVFGSIPFYSV